MSTYNAKVYEPQGADTFVIDEGGTLSFNTTTNAVTLTVTSGKLIIANLPTANPAVAGALWNNAGVLTVSAG